MEPFGPYEVTREIASGPGAVVYAARKQGDKDAGYTVKVFSLEPLLGQDHDSRSDLDPLLVDLARSFNSRTEVQKKAAASSRHVAPILEVGKDYRGAWYATHLYPRSVQKIIAGRVVLNPQDFHHVLHSTVRAALDFKRVCGRSHGNIRTTNIFIGGAGKLKDDDIVLSDPLPGDETEAVRYELADLRGIGQIILQLVRRREITDDADWMIVPILKSNEWTELFGKEADGWLEICNRLLDPKLSLETYTLERLEADLAPLKPKPPVSTPLVATIAGIAVLVVVGLILLLKPSNKGTLVISSDPPGAKIFVNGVEIKLAEKEKSVRQQLPAASVELRAEYPGFDPLRRTVQVPARKETNIVFEFPYGTLVVDSEPRGASIRLGGKEVGSPTPATISLVRTGQVQIELSKGDTYEPSTVVTNVRQRQTTTVFRQLQDVTANRQIVEFVSDPPGAEVRMPYLQNQVMKLETGTGRRSVPLGTNVYFIASFPTRDWESKTQLVTIVKTSSIPVIAFRWDYGQVALDSSPPGARVSVGNKPVGQTPTTLVWTLGSATFKFELDDYETTNLTVTVAAANRSSPARLNPSLISTKPILALTSDPAPAQVLDGTRVVATTRPGAPTLVPVPAGPLTLTARYPGLGDVTRQVTAVSRRTIPVSFDFDYGQVVLAGLPAGTVVRRETQTANFVAPELRFIQRSGVAVPYSIKAPDYDQVDTNVTVGSKQTQVLSLTLLPERVNVALHSDPPGAQFFDLRENPGTPLVAPNNIAMLRWGTNLVAARDPVYGLDPVTNRFRVVKGQANQQAFLFNYGLVSVTSAPPGAVVREGGKDLGKTPFQLISRPGRREFQLAMGGRTTNVIAVVQGGQNEVSVGQTFPRLNYTNSVGLEFVQVNPVLWASQYEVTQAQYEKVMNELAPELSKQDARRPVRLVSWTKAAAFCEKLSALDKDTLLANQLSGWTYALPSEDEWRKELAPDPASYAGAVIAKGTSAPLDVDSARASFNERRIYDLIGNVAEWTADKTAIGGSYANNLKPATMPADHFVLTLANKRLNPVIIDSSGATTIGIRPVLKKP